MKSMYQLHLRGLYPHATLLEGNDARFLDVGVLSKLPLGGVTSWQHQVHPEDPTRRVFARELLEIEILNQRRSHRADRSSPHAAELAVPGCGCMNDAPDAQALELLVHADPERL